MDAEERIKPQHAKRYRSLCTQMQNLLNEIGRYEPEVNLYLEDSGNWHLMVGPTHDESKGSLPPLYDNVAISCTVHPSGGGGW